MGTLRFIFTITIILGHIYSIFGFRYHELLSSPIAFESFFLLSGFYMAMVWDSDYSRLKGGFKKFLFKRVLRIFPLYWLVLATTFLVSLLTYALLNDAMLLQPAFAHWHQLNWTVRFYILFSNLFIFGQEAIFFLKINFDTGNFAWSQRFIDGDPPLHFFLLVSQAWAISYILYFYLLLPLLSRFNSLFIILFVALLLAARFTWYHMGHQCEPWLYRFFPFEMAFFLAGMLSARFYSSMKEKLREMKYAGIILFVLFLIATCAYDLWSLDYLRKQWLYYGMLFALMPLFFAITKSNKTDNYLGQLAYPAYLSNFIVIHLLQLAGVSDHLTLIIAVLVITLLVSAVLVRFIIEPLNSFALGKIGVLKKAV